MRNNHWCIKEGCEHNGELEYDRGYAQGVEDTKDDLTDLKLTIYKLFESYMFAAPEMHSFWIDKITKVLSDEK